MGILGSATKNWLIFFFFFPFGKQFFKAHPGTKRGATRCTLEKQIEDAQRLSRFIQGIENKEKCSSRFHQMITESVSRNHDAHYCSLFEKNDHFCSDVCFLSPQARTVLYIISSIHRTLSNPLAFPLRTPPAGAG